MLNPSPAKGITAPLGFRAAGGRCGIKASGKPDLALIVADRPCAAAGVFTTNCVPSPSVLVARQHLSSGRAQAVICNSGISNASTGPLGRRNAQHMCKLLARHVRLRDPSLALPCSTGVIGKQLPMDKISRGVADLAPRLARGRDADSAAAHAIMTTDLAPKQAHRSLRLGAATVQIAGIAKGSGMIAPNMATMLAFITTDAAVTPRLLARALRHAADHSFNRISVDQHTSPSDSVLVLASGAAGNRKITAAGRAFNQFQAALTDLCYDLAYKIVQDGEGATKVFHVLVTAARSQADADRVAQAVVNSPLVKTAVHGSDPNWGRIVTAAGYADADVQPEKMSLHISPAPESHRPGHKPDPRSVCVFRRGQPTTLNAASQRRLAKVMAAREIVFYLHLALGSASTHWLGCDLSRRYVAINAGYTT